MTNYYELVNPSWISIVQFVCFALVFFSILFGFVKCILKLLKGASVLKSLFSPGPIICLIISVIGASAFLFLQFYMAPSVDTRKSVFDDKFSKSELNHSSIASVPIYRVSDNQTIFIMENDGSVSIFDKTITKTHKSEEPSCVKTVRYDDGAIYKDFYELYLSPEDFAMWVGDTE